MRDYALLIVFFGALPLVLRSPYFGVLVWSWVGYMNPHQLSWTLRDFPFAKVAALAFFISLLINKEEKKFPINNIFLAWCAFLLWAGVTTTFAIYPDGAFAQYQKILKIQLILFLALLLMKNKERIHLSIWCIFISIGFYGVKGGLFAIRTGGGGRVWGPAGGYIEENNALAVALLMVLPLGYYLYKYTKDKWGRRALIFAMVLLPVSIAASQSRGAFLAIICVSGYFWWKSKNKLMIGIAILALLPAIYLSMPQSWHDRMATIQTYDEDASAMGRINAWKYAYNVANARITGGGLESWSRATFIRWAPNPDDVHAAHSIYFSVLADHGWVGLGLFLFVFIGAWRLCGSIARRARGDPEHGWMEDLARMIQVSLIAYGSGGAFLSLSYFDLPWHLVGIVIMMDHILKHGPQPHVPLFKPKKKAATGNTMSAPAASRLQSDRPSLKR